MNMAWNSKKGNSIVLSLLPLYYPIKDRGCTDSWFWWKKQIKKFQQLPVSWNITQLHSHVWDRGSVGSRMVKYLTHLKSFSTSSSFLTWYTKLRIWFTFFSHCEYEAAVLGEKIAEQVSPVCPLSTQLIPQVFNLSHRRKSVAYLRNYLSKMSWYILLS